MKYFPFLGAALMATMPPIVSLRIEDEPTRPRSRPASPALLLGEGVRQLRGGKADMTKPKGKRGRRRRKT